MPSFGFVKIKIKKEKKRGKTNRSIVRIITVRTATMIIRRNILSQPKKKKKGVTHLL